MTRRKLWRNRKERKDWARRLQSEDPGLEVVHPHAAGIDVGNSAHYVAVRPDRDPEPVRRFECFTADLYRLAEWLESCGVKTVAMQSNLVILGFKPSPVVTKQVHAEWPITLELEGNYHNLAAFFDRLGKFTRIVNISALEVKGKENKAQPAVTIAAKCVATTFVLLDKAAIEAAKEKANAKGGKPAPKPAAAAKKVA